jgi:lipid II:glycine glycyltransferase (peptidoglycan interpeptide bridge formation enzyme)
MTARQIETPVRDVRREPSADWDAWTVDPPGGHVLQGEAWAAHRSAQGWTPRFVTFDDDRAALVLTHHQPPLPGFVAYAPRGPISAGDSAERVAARAAGLAAWLRNQGATILAVDPELDADPAYDAALTRAGFHPTEELQPSRHRMVLPLPAGDGPDEVFARISKQTRQRIRAAEQAGTTVVDDVASEHLEAFGRLVDATAERKRFDFATDRGFLDWWRRVVASGRGRFWVALNDDRLLGGLLTYRQGGHIATAFSADRADLRSEMPGTMHLLRWHAIREAVERGCPLIDLGGVDVRGARRRPEKDDPGYGLYEHKTSFGAVWVESTSAHEIVLRPFIYRAGLAARRARRLVRGRS